MTSLTCENQLCSCYKKWTPGLCFSSFVCHFQKSWDIALGPFKQIPMNLFIMYMAGNSISIFPIMMVGMMFLRPVKALLAIKSSKNVYFYYDYYLLFCLWSGCESWCCSIQQQLQLLTLTAHTLLTNSYVSNRIHTVHELLSERLFWEKWWAQLISEVLSFPCPIPTAYSKLPLSELVIVYRQILSPQPENVHKLKLCTIFDIETNSTKR